MTATKKRCVELIRLLSSLDFFPTDTAVRELLANTLQRAAANDSHAERIVERWLERERKAPVVADIISIARELPTAKPSSPDGCEICHGEPFITTDFRGQGYATRCTCARGRYLATREAEERVRKAA